MLATTHEWWDRPTMRPFALAIKAAITVGQPRRLGPDSAVQKALDANFGLDGAVSEEYYAFR